MDKRIWILVFFAVAGVYFLGKGITGLVISQSCCFPPGCSEENLCQAAKPSLESPMSTNGLFIVFGLFIIAASVLFVKLLHRGKNYKF